MILKNDDMARTPEARGCNEKMQYLLMTFPVNTNMRLSCHLNACGHFEPVWLVELFNQGFHA